MNSSSPATVFLALGSNMGSRYEFLLRALEQLESVSLVPPVLSKIFDTDPLGPTPQNRYLNMCVKISTHFNPIALLDFCKSIETSLGRVHRVKWGPREIDIDILYYDAQIIRDSRLIIPHPEIANRSFVLAPLADIAGDFNLPGSQMPLIEYIDYLLPLEERKKIIRFSPPATVTYATTQAH